MNTSTETCPSLEDLAAFLDGGLYGDERARIVAHLASCPACYEVFTEAARFKISEEEEEREEPDPPEKIKVPPELVAAAAASPHANVVPFRRTQVFRWISSIAAVLVVGVTAISFYRQSSTMPEISSARLVNRAVQEKAAEDPFWDDLAKRGGPGQNVGLASIPHEVLLGAHALELHLSLGRNDRESALNDLAGINTHIEEIGLLPDEAKAYAAIREQIDEGRPAREFVQEAEKVEAGLPAKDDPFFALGKWIEAGRLSALAESPDFFTNPENRKFLRVFLRQERELLEADPEVVKALEEIQDILKEADPSSLPYQELQQKFEKILTFYQNKSEEELEPAGLSPAP